MANEDTNIAKNSSGADGLHTLPNGTGVVMKLKVTKVEASKAALAGNKQEIEGYTQQRRATG